MAPRTHEDGDLTTKIHELLSASEQRIGDRFDAVVEKIEDVGKLVSAEIAKCGICRPIVLGRNGIPSIETRMDRLEQGQAKWSKFRWTVLAGLFTVGAAVLAWIPRALGWW